MPKENLPFLHKFHFFHKNNAIIYVICRIGNPHIHCIEIYLKKKKIKTKMKSFMIKLFFIILYDKNINVLKVVTGFRKRKK